MNCGSGVMHAEGGGSAAGTFVQGFQIWINVNTASKMEDPQYGTIPTEELPVVKVSEGVAARVLAGEAFGAQGPFKTKQAVQMIDIELDAQSRVKFEIPPDLDTAMAYVYEGDLLHANASEEIESGHVVLFDANTSLRGLELATAQTAAKVLVFAGKKLKEPIAWHGPIVMNTQSELMETFRDLQNGNFPPRRVDWDYTQLSEFPEARRHEIEAAHRALLEETPDAH